MRSQRPSRLRRSVMIQLGVVDEIAQALWTCDATQAGCVRYCNCKCFNIGDQDEEGDASWRRKESARGTVSGLIGHSARLEAGGR